MDNKYIDEKDISNIIEIRNEPHIYAFSTETIPNYVKVGDTFRPIEKRLSEWKKHFAHLIRLYPNTNEEAESIAKVDDDIYFRDYEVHSYLKKNKFENLTEQDFNLLFNKSGNLYYSNEFFKNATPNDIRLAISDIKENYANKSNIYKYFKLSNSTRISYVEHWTNSEDWALRPNQKNVVENFVKKVNDGETDLLMYAVMRFGKSFTAISCALAKEYKKILVVSAKADVVNEWKKTVEKPKCFKDYAFLCDEDFKLYSKKDNNLIDDILNKKICDNNYLSSKSRVVVFLTLQNLSGKDSSGKNIKERLEKIFLTEFDLIIIDETHFGAWANNYGAPLAKDEDKESVNSDIKENKKFIDAIENKKLKSKIKLHLSGTPYNLLYDQKFTEKNIIATCQFSDILNDKQKWDEDFLGKVIPGTSVEYEEYDNPYFGFPKMLRFAFNIPENIQNVIEGSKDKYSLNNLFLTNEQQDTKFIHEKDVLTLLKAIDSKDNQTDGILSFLDIPKIKNNKVCKHIVMVLPFKYSCDAMELLLKNNKDQFKNLYNDNVEILNITGHNLQQKYNNIDNVKNAISNFEKQGKKTITLTVNKMLTGVTVPEWDTMIMLKNTRSAQEYDQAIFRIQNQYVKEIEEDTDKKEKRTAKIDLKPQTILVDFDPLRMFELQGLSTRIVNNIDKNSNIQLDKAIKRELEFFPIISYNANKIVKVTPNNIVELISEYNKNKSLVEQSKAVDLDVNLLKNEQFRNFLNSLSEKGLKSNLSGFTHSGEDTSDVDTSVPNNNDKSDVKTNEEIDKNNNNTKTDLSKNEQKIDAKKYQTFVSSLLFFSFLTKSKIFTIKDIIDKIENKNNDNENYDEDRRIFNNLNLNLNMIKYHYNDCNKFSALKLDKKITYANLLSKNDKLTLEQRVKTALNNFSYISESEIVTPLKIATEMCNLIGIDKLKDIVNNNGKILDIASKTGEFSVALYNLLSTHTDIPKEKIINAIYCIPTSNLTRELTLKVYDILGLNKSNIANITAYSLLEYHKFEFNKKQNKNIETKELDYDKIIEILSDGKTFNKGGQIMKFDAVVGNPPYQENIENRSEQPPVYHLFYNIAFNLSKKVTLITPARFLFNAGKTPKEWNEKILSDTHFNVVDYIANSKDVFPTVEIKGGVSITYRDETQSLGPVGIYVKNEELNNILNKVKSITNKYLDSIIYSNTSYKYSKKLFEEHPNFISRVSGGSSRYLSSSAFDKLPEMFYNKPNGGNENYIKIIGRQNSHRAEYYTKLKYLVPPQNFDKYKVFISSSNGTGKFGETLTMPFIGEPNVGATETFVSFGDYNEKSDAENLIKYIKSKFARTLLGTLKVTQGNKNSWVWSNIPLQDFTNKSDIDWSKSVAEIDKQLYKKYNLTQEEIDFIEKTVKPME